MIYTYEYASEYDPPMPIVELKLALEADGESQTLKAIVDSGADATMIPMRFLKQINASPNSRKWMRGVAGGRYKVSLYTVSIQLGNHQMYTSVVGDPINDEVILGRDVLNRLVVTLDGMASAVLIEAAE